MIILASVAFSAPLGAAMKMVMYRMPAILALSRGDALAIRLIMSTGYPTQRLEILASGHYFSQHRADFSVDDDIRLAVHVGRLAVDNGERGAVRLCDHW